MIETTANTKITEAQLQNEADYYRSFQILKKMIDKKLITNDEFKKIDKLNVKSFSPYLAQLLS